MKKTFSIIIFLLITMIATNVLAVAQKADVKMEIVEDNICTIKLNEESTFEKKIIEHQLEKHEVTLQLQISNNAKNVIPSGELVLVIDSSNSMNEIVEGTTTRKELVLNSANELVKSLLKANPTSLKIGVVTFSTGNEKDSEGNLITGTEADAQKVCDFTNDLNTLTSKISKIEGTGPYTNLDAGLKLAKSQFTTEENNKYMILLTDGLPNLAVGYNDLVSYNGLTDVLTETKTTIASLKNIEMISMLTGITEEEEKATFRTDGTNTYTYGQVIEEIFGTEQNAKIGKFYKIDDAEIKQTITDKIYHDLIPVNSILEDIVIKDYFPQYIVDNFEMTYVEGIDTSNISANIDKETNSITWNIGRLEGGQTATIQYKLTLKDEFDEMIIEKILDTNEKVDITYKGFDGKTKEETSNVTPKIKLTNIPKGDNTVALQPIPEAGAPIMIGAIILITAITIFLGYKYKKHNI